jgi:GNAT superfamily N-acetyltransferase
MAQAHDLQFHIRYATASDNTLLAQVGAETFYDRSAADNTPQNMASYLAASFSPEKQARELADPASRFLIAEVADVTVGYAHLKFGPAPTAIVGRKLI